MGSLPSQPTAAARIWSKMRRRVGCQVRHLDDRARVALVLEIDETAARAVAFLSHGVAALERLPVQHVVVFRPARPVLEPLAPRSQEVAVHARRLAALLDQLDLHVARVRERDRHVKVVVADAAIAEGCQRQSVDVEPRSNTADIDPMAHRRVDIAHHITHLTQRPEQSTHVSPRPFSDVEPRPLRLRGEPDAHLAEVTAFR